MNFMHAMAAARDRNRSMLCVGLDPEPEKFPAHLRGHPDAIFEFCRAVIDATADLVCAFKPQIAHFAARGEESTLQRLIEYIHAEHSHVQVILDAKRGDIGSTAAYYAEEAFDRYKADAVTLNPYLGRDSVQPFLDRTNKGAVLLCRTSNSGAADFQDLPVDGMPLYQRVAKIIADDWNGNGNCLLVTGATWPSEIGQIRALVGDMPLLVPGIGAQGGDVEAVVKNGQDARGNGLLISSSRSILYASNGDDFSNAARAAALNLRDEINRHRK